MKKQHNRLAGRLADARRRFFVGREAEKVLFENLIDADSKFRVLYLFAAGGIGKTSLLREYAALAEARALPVIQLDARSITAMPQAVAKAVQQARDRLSVAEDTPHIIVLDTYELLAPLESWLREQWLPAQADCVRVVIAGRTPPSLAWRTDTAWADSLRHHQLPYLQEELAREYLQRREMPPAAIEQGISFARGHPLALALFADAAVSGQSDAPEQVPDPETLLPELMAGLLGNVQDESRRRALYACAIVRSLPESLLGVMLDQTQCSELFAWLRNLSFIESGPGGLFPHDLIRDVLVADLKQCDPDLYHLLGERAYTWYLQAIEANRGDVLTHGLDAFFLLGDMELPWHMAGPAVEEPAYIDAASDQDMNAVEAMLRRHEGAAEVANLRRLVAAQPEALQVIRDTHQQVIGFSLLLALQELPADVIAADPVCAAFQARCSKATNKDGRVSLLRYWMHAEHYMRLSSIVTLGFISLVLEAVRPGQAYSGARQLDDEVWRYIADLVGHQRLEGSEQNLPGGATVVMYQDFRQRSALDWLRNVFRRIQGLAEAPSSTATPQYTAMDRPAFDQAVRDALKHYHRPHRLADNPLLTAPLVIQRAGSNDSTACLAALQAVLEDSYEELADNPQTEPLARALRHTYLKPAANQELAAEAAQMAYGSFRRHLSAAVREVQTRLWLAEQNARAGD